MSASEGQAAGHSQVRQYIPWLNLALTIALVAAGIYYLSARVGLGRLAEALSSANVALVALATGIMVLTLALKAWRWQLLYAGTDASVPYDAAFWSSILGQYVNFIVPVLRLGEIARIYSINREARVSAAQTVGTLVVEKVLDLIFFGLAILLVIPFVAVPELAGQPVVLFFVGPSVALIVLYVLAFRTEQMTQLLTRIAQPLPDRLGDWITRIAVAGMEGLAALRDRRQLITLLALSLIVTVLGVLLPYVLFLSLDLNLTLIDAIVMHIVVSVAIAPPSTPAKIGVFNGAAALVLWRMGIRDEAIIYSFAILYHLVVVTPELILGIFASIRSRWSWQTALDAPVSETA